ncbi:MAG: preprotein translocase subunit SecG [Lachnospiraceae bacterium]|jgi:preprotein translocase subunit SecG|nr:preprotein translocase subunit SecG [Lachnospiraceae bacterium]
MLKIIVTVVFVIAAVFLAAVVLLQEGKQQGLGTIGGAAETYFGRNKGRTMEAMLERLTKISAVLFMLLALALDILN